jgi:hypothetical protein
MLALPITAIRPEDRETDDRRDDLQQRDHNKNVARCGRSGE